MPLAGMVALAALLIGALGWTHAYLESGSTAADRAAGSESAAYERLMAISDAAGDQAKHLCPEILHICRS
jgi:hypothetical protein